MLAASYEFNSVVDHLLLWSNVRTERFGFGEGSMLLQFLICFLMNHANLSFGPSLAAIQMNAAMLAAGLFAFIGFRLRMDARARERRLAAALLMW
jgi:hypothetical protein